MRKCFLVNRIIDEADYLIKNKCTIREAAAVFNISKSTIHIDITKRLKQLDLEIYSQVMEVLQYNLSVRHLRGGESTKNKFVTTNKK